MFLFLLTQDERSGYDTFDSCIVCAPNKEMAKQISPAMAGWASSAWASKPDNVECKLIGTATSDIKEGVVLRSFNAG